MLAAELAQHEDDEGRRWSVALAPLADAFAQRFLTYLPKATYPTRTGVHSNTAFALALALDYAAVCRHQDLAETVANTARRWYLGDRDCQAWEPSGEDFLSPCLMEAECMRRVMSQEEFVPWFNRFLPRLERAGTRGHIRASDRQRPHRWQDCPSRWSQPQPFLVLEQSGVGHARYQIRGGM